MVLPIELKRLGTADCVVIAADKSARYEDVIGTQGTPVELLGGLIKKKLFPELWQVRKDLTELANETD